MFFVGFCTFLDGKWLNMKGTLLCWGEKLHSEIKHILCSVRCNRIWNN